ncbi:MAG: hypothetical protein QG573_1095 [Acidobacteriota bacterium]|nr:hypothetical protein [Acidobacteriota bacterium]
MPRNDSARRRTALALALLVAVAVVPFLGAVRGEFIYDDRVQILDNPLIQQPGLLGQALTSDVFAFKGERDRAWSNYFRPAFVLWLAGNWRLFGAQPLGWHLTNLALHAGVVLLAFALLRRLGFALPTAFFGAALFAVHPVHVESVAWISGSPDLLMSVGFLGTLVLEAPAPGRLRGVRRILALALAALALLSKETALLLPLVVAALAWNRSGDLPSSSRARVCMRAMLPYAALAGAFLLARHEVIGGFATATPWTLRPVDLALSLPGVGFFYLRQALLPFWIGPTYPLRTVTLDTVGWANFALPLLATLALAGLCWVASRRSPNRPLFAALALLPLAPALNLSAFMPEQIVHDRYLYLPLLGLLGILGSFGSFGSSGSSGSSGSPGSARASASRVARKETIPRQPVGAGILGLALLFLLAARTIALVPDYRDERALFTAAVRTDPGAAFHWAQLAATEFRLGQFAAAAQAADRALALKPVTTALLVRADLASRAGRFAAAEKDLAAILTSFPDHTAAIERLAIALTSQGKRAEAIALLRKSRTTAPWRECAMTGNLAVVLYLDGQKAAAVKELEGLRQGGRVDATAACGLALFRLGSLYLELGQATEARRAFVDYLRTSAGSDASFHVAPRAEAERAIAGLPPGR